MTTGFMAITKTCEKCGRKYMVAYENAECPHNRRRRTRDEITLEEEQRKLIEEGEKLDRELRVPDGNLLNTMLNKGEVKK